MTMHSAAVIVRRDDVLLFLAARSGVVFDLSGVRRVSLRYTSVNDLAPC